MPKGASGKSTELGHRLRHLRTEVLDKTQAQIAEILGITTSHYSKIEVGASGIGSSLLSSICSQFDVDRDWLLAGVGQPPGISRASADAKADSRTSGLHRGQDSTPWNGEMRETEGEGVWPSRPEEIILTDDVLERIVKLVQDHSKQDVVARLAADLCIPESRAWLFVVREELRRDE